MDLEGDRERSCLLVGLASETQVLTGLCFLLTGGL